MSHVMSNVPCVKCYMSHVTHQVSHVTYHVSCFFVCFIDTVGKLLGGGSVINGVTPPSWVKYVPNLTLFCRESELCRDFGFFGVFL